MNDGGAHDSDSGDVNMDGMMGTGDINIDYNGDGSVGDCDGEWHQSR